MGKKKDEKRARKAAKVAEAGQQIEGPAAQIPLKVPPLLLEAAMLDTGSADVVSASMVLTKADRKRLRMLAIQRRTSFRRLMHQAWNHFLASEGLPGLTPVYVSDLQRRADRHED